MAWINLKDTILCDISSHRKKFCMIQLIGGMKYSQTHQSRKSGGGCQGLVGKLRSNGYKF